VEFKSTSMACLCMKTSKTPKNISRKNHQKPHQKKAPTHLRRRPPSPSSAPWGGPVTVTQREPTQEVWPPMRCASAGAEHPEGARRKADPALGVKPPLPSSFANALRFKIERTGGRLPPPPWLFGCPQTPPPRPPRKKGLPPLWQSYGLPYVYGWV
jgi:hypothetical protein